MADIETGGGGNVRGNVEAGDFTGRDRVAGGSVHVTMPDRSLEDASRKMYDVIFGDGLKWKGIVRELERLEERIVALTDEVTSMKTELAAVKYKLDEVTGGRAAAGDLRKYAIYVAAVGSVASVLYDALRSAGWF